MTFLIKKNHLVIKPFVEKLMKLCANLIRTESIGMYMKLDYRDRIKGKAREVLDTSN